MQRIGMTEEETIESPFISKTIEDRRKKLKSIILIFEETYLNMMMFLISNELLYII